MTVQQLRPPAVFTDRVEAARAEVQAAAAVPLGSVEQWELGSTLAALTRLEAQVAALKLEVLAEADRRQVADEAADTGTDAWAARLTGSNRAVMAGGLRLARLLNETYHATRDAFAAGKITVDQVQVIVKAADKLPSQVTEEQRALAEQGLVDKAVSGTNPRALRQAARRMLERVSKKLADQHEADQLDDEKDRAEVETWLSLHDNGDGTFTGRFTIPELHGHLLATALERLSAPRRWGRNKAGKPVVDETLPGEGPTLSWTERLGAAFCEILEHLPSDGHGSVGVTLLVRMDFEHLLDQLGSARLDTGVTISAGEARRLACNAGIVPVVLGGKSEVLNLGRKQRLHSTAIRYAASLIHETCATEGCERPFAWCEMHHPQPWSEGGETSLENSLPLCGFHHRRAHDNRYRMRILPSGEVRFRRRR